jgi:ribosome biogenesis GTPase
VNPPRRRRELDESDVRIRPNPRGSRPRTKERPRHEDSEPGWVLAVDRGRYTVLLGGPDTPDADEHLVTAMKARELGRAGVVVGDRVALVGDVTGGTGTLARIVRVEERTNLLRRSADDVAEAVEGAAERPIVANADQLAVVTALADPEPRPRMVDRCLVAAYDAGLDPLLVLTKADLTDPAPFLAAYAPLDVPYVVTRRAADGTLVGLDEVRERLADRVTVLIGHSGVGKSTLVNALVPGTARATGVVNDVTGRGRHTSSSAVVVRLPGGGWVVDTPGVRSFGLAHVDPDRILGAFPDLAAGTGECPRGCSHDEPECGLDEFVASGGAGPAGPARLDSLRRLLRSRAGADEPPPAPGRDERPPDG